MWSKPMTQWTDKMIATLKHLHTAGHSCASIAAEMGQGLTRNAIIGKIHRLGLGGTTPKPRSAPKIRKRRETPAAKKFAKPEPKPIIDVLQFARLVNGSGIPLLQRSAFQCSWAVDEASNNVCGQPIGHSRFSWCPYHASIGLVKPVRTERRDTERQRTNEHAFL
jgi:hypothetical protein